MNMAGFDVDGLTLVLLSFGIASFVGTSLSSAFLKRSLKVALAGAPLVLAISAAVLVLWGSDKWVASAIADYLGLCFCAGAGGLVDVDHPLARRSGGKSRVDSGRGDPAGEHLRCGDRRRCAGPSGADVTAGDFRYADAADRAAGGGEG